MHNVQAHLLYHLPAHQDSETVCMWKAKNGERTAGRHPQYWHHNIPDQAHMRGRWQIAGKAKGRHPDDRIGAINDTPTPSATPPS